MKSRRRAQSLVETVIAIFILLCACLVIIALFHSSLRFSNAVITQSTAVRLAEKKLAEIRGWARDPATFESNWDTQWGGTQNYPDEGNYSIRVDTVNHTLYSPCSELERQYGGDARKLNQSCRRVTVTVTWLPASPLNQVSLTSLISAPPRPGTCDLVVQVTIPANPLAMNDTLLLRAHLNDANGDEIPDVMFTWHVVPGAGSGGNGNGILDPTKANTKRSGASVVFRNIYPSPRSWDPVAGRVAARANCRYRGLDYRQTSPSWQVQE